MEEALISQEERKALLVKLTEASHFADEKAQQGILKDYQRKKSENTRRRQRFELTLFERFLAEMEIPLTGFFDDLSLWSGISRGILVAFQLWMEQSGYSFGAINLHLSTIRVYSKMAYSAGDIQRDTWQHIANFSNISKREADRLNDQREKTSIGTKKAEPTPITPAQMALLKKKLRESDDLAAPRDLLMLCLLADHGMRVSEVAALQMDHIDIPNARFLIDRQKTSLKHHHLFLPETLEALQSYLQAFPRGPMDTVLGIKIATIRWRIARIGQLIGLDLSPHDLRHYFGTYAKGDLLEVAKAGGWTTLNMLLRYRFDLENANQNITMPTE